MLEQSEGKTVSPVREQSIEFEGIVGQADLKESLLLIAANDALDGLLIRGEKGTAKSTAVRALADLLPAQRAIEDCPYSCPPDVPEKQCESCRERVDPPIAERPVPLVTLPLGATREQVVGTLSVADALDGEYEFDPGLLARANRGILYVDEVNLLDDHLVDVLLDAAASGVNRVERDGISVTHPAEFTLVGTMNPEEGELRPQLRDRFALSTTVTGCEEVAQRVAIVERALGKETTDPGSDTEHDTTDTAVDGGRIGRTATPDPESRLRWACEHLDEVVLSAEDLASIAECCREAGVEGHRGDIATARASRTLAALNGRRGVLEDDLRRGAKLALGHRLRSRPFKDAPDTEEVVDEHFDGGETEESSDEMGEGNDETKGTDGEQEDGASDADGEGGADGARETSDEDGENDPGSTEKANAPDRSDANGEGSKRGSDRSPGEDVTDTGSAAAESGGTGDDGGDEEGTTRNDVDDAEGGEAGDDTEAEPVDRAPLVPGQAPADIGEARAPDLPAPDAIEEGGGERVGKGSRSHAKPSVDRAGPRVRTRQAESTNATDSIDAAASIRAAGSRGASRVESRDLRQSVRQGEANTLVLFVVDASASMRPAMRAAKGTVLELLKDSYQQRDEVGFIAFAGEGAEVLLPPTDSVTLAARHLKELPTGDRTPLPAGLDVASEVLERADPAASVVVLVTDGRANVAEGSPVERTRTAAGRVGELASRAVVVDAGEDGRTGLVGPIVEATGGQRLDLAALSADHIDATTDAARESM
jgi:magnesium chelatase subunit D